MIFHEEFGILYEILFDKVKYLQKFAQYCVNTSSAAHAMNIKRFMLTIFKISVSI